MDRTEIEKIVSSLYQEVFQQMLLVPFPKTGDPILDDAGNAARAFLAMPDQIGYKKAKLCIELADIFIQSQPLT
jgi:hypothetical protein